MNISDTIPILKIERILGRTPKGRAINEYAIETLNAAIQDEKNHHSDVTECLGCGFIISNLLIEDGCPNCGAVDLTENLNKMVIQALEQWKQTEVRSSYDVRTRTISKISWQSRFRTS